MRHRLIGVLTFLAVLGGMNQNVEIRGQAPPLFPRLQPSHPIISQNQQVADTIAQVFRHSGQLRGYQVHIAFADGVAQLQGQVSSHAQRAAAVRLAQTVPGVRQVRDQLVVRAAGGIVRVQGEEALPVPEDAPLPKKMEAGMNPGNPAATAFGGGGSIQEPMPIQQQQPGCMPQMQENQPPPMPPYAWPSYAPYNNFSRVAYPTLYPYQSWPFIGPFYPFPKVPPGWRSVTLTWQDGFWWYGRNATSHDWWRVRYW